MSRETKQSAHGFVRKISVCVAKDTKSEVQGQETRQGELQLVVEQRTVWENSFLDAGLHRTL